MRRVILILGITLLSCRSTYAQRLSLVDLFGGYSNFWENHQHVNGWNASVAMNANRWFSIVGAQEPKYADP